MNIKYDDTITNCALKNDFWNEQMIGHCKCKNCGQEANVDMSLVLTSYPPQYNYSCPHCGKRGYILCSEAYVKNSHEDNQDKTIEELKEQVRQLEKRIKELENQKEPKYNEESGETHIIEEIEKVRNGDRD